MVRRIWENLLLRPEDLAPSRDRLEVIGVFNPGVVRVGDEVVLLVRVAERPREVRRGSIALPRWEPSKGLSIDWVPEEEWEFLDPRVVRRKSDGLVRLTFLSHLCVVRSRDGRSVEDVSGPRFFPHDEQEEYGVEDPRITPIGDRFYFTYVAVSRHGVATALASTADFVSFQRHGVIFAPENKDVVLFPERIDGQYVALHRPSPATRFSPLEMWVARSPDLVHWGQHTSLSGGLSPWETGRIGAGPPPIRIAEGWLEIYHGNRRPIKPGEVGAYAAGAMLLALDDPTRILGRSREAILVPQASFETQGFVPNVVFPTGIVDTGETLLVYYGASDTYTAVVEVAREELLAEVR